MQNFAMTKNHPRAIVVIDVGYTNTKAILFSPQLNVVAERKMPSSHKQGADYKIIDAEPIIDFLRTALIELDAIMPVDAIVPCAHGACLVALNSSAELAFPIMDYASEPPTEITAEFKLHQPPFDEVFCPLLPMALTHALQLFWLEKINPEKFLTVKTIMPWMQYIAFKLSGVASTEISSMACQTMLLNVNTGEPSSIAKKFSWDKYFAPRQKAWSKLGKLTAEFSGPKFNGHAQVLTGIHDSNANYVRYLAAGIQSFTLLSTGTWIISFNSAAHISELDHTKDTNTNTDVFGTPVACSRFFGGKELETVSKGAAPELASVAMVQNLIEANIMALPAFSDSGGPIANVGDHGKISGPFMEGPEARASLAALYCALMVSAQLNAVASANDIIVDGPFSTHGVFLAVLAALRKNQNLFASTLRDGTAAGAACLALFEEDQLPAIKLALTPIGPAPISGLEAYAKHWRIRAEQH
jgi:sugar (pentulose or hexulose) kinase